MRRGLHPSCESGLRASTHCCNPAGQGTADEPSDRCGAVHRRRSPDPGRYRFGSVSAASRRGRPGSLRTRAGSRCRAEIDLGGSPARSGYRNHPDSGRGRRSLESGRPSGPGQRRRRRSPRCTRVVESHAPAHEPTRRCVPSGSPADFGAAGASAHVGPPGCGPVPRHARTAASRGVACTVPCRRQWERQHRRNPSHANQTGCRHLGQRRQVSPSRAHPSRAHPGRPHPGRSHPGRSHPGRSHPGRSHPGRSHPSRPHPGRSHPSRQRLRQPRQPGRQPQPWRERQGQRPWSALRL